MKTFATTIIAVLLFTITCNAQWTAGTGIITTTNNVGIGTTTPSAKLHVTGTGVSIDGGNAIGINVNGLAIQGNSGGRSSTVGAQLEFVIPANTDGSNFWGQARIITVAGSANTSDATGKMIFGTRRMFNKLGTGSQWYYGNDLTIDGVGNVGIGSVSPDQKLTVNGTVHAKAVLVDVNVFPDFVFEKGYNLPSLTSIKTYIDKNHHLPEIPSAADVIKNGQNLGDLNTLLLKKVEELTLYLIEKDKEVKGTLDDIRKVRSELESEKENNKALADQMKKLEQMILQLKKETK